jgi:hypothetical protein
VDLDADGFYDLFTDGTPEVSTSQPSPGSFVDAYNECAAAGHREVISIHVGESLSGTLNSARIAAGMVDIDVHLVDSRTLSFGVGACVWRAGEMLAAGAGIQDTIASVGQLADDLYSVTALGAAVDDICDLMATTMHRDGAPIRVALGIADSSAIPYYEGLESRLSQRDDIVEIVRYRIGPSVGAFTGLGTAGGFYFPA